MTHWKTLEQHMQSKITKYKFPSHEALRIADLPQPKQTDNPVDLEYCMRVTLRNWQVTGAGIMYYDLDTEDAVRRSDAVPKRALDYPDSLLMKDRPSAMMFVPSVGSILPICWIGISSESFTIIAENPKGFSVSAGPVSVVPMEGDALDGVMTETDLETQLQLWVLAFELSSMKCGEYTVTTLGNWIVNQNANAKH